MEGTELAATEVVEALERPPIIDRVDRQQLALIKATVAEHATDAEVGMFLELAAHYGLDPFAKEVWCAKGKPRDGKPGRLLIMVGRDGLRKIAQRQGFYIDGDVVRERDKFRVSRDPTTRERAIWHSYEEAGGEGMKDGEVSTRGRIVGAWAEVWDMAGKQRGYFYAPLTEYRPTSEAQLQYSPWGAQESVMILAAAERQALRQATPLSGLLVEGEADRNMELATEAEASSGADLPLEVTAVIDRARRLGHAGFADRATVEMAVVGRSPNDVADWVTKANANLDELAQLNGGEAETVEIEMTDEAAAEALNAAAFAAADAADAAEQDGNTEEAEELRGEAERLRARADAIQSPEQETIEGME